MGLTNFEQMLVDSNGNPVGVSGSMALPVGAIGQLLAGVNPNTNVVEYLSSVSGSLKITGSVDTNVVFPSSMLVAPESPSGFWNTGPMSVSGTVQVYTSGLQGVSGSVSVSNFPANQEVWTVGPVGVSGTVSVAQPIQVWSEGAVGVTGSVTVSPASPSGFWSSGPMAVSGAIHTGSTANGYPVTVGGV